MSDKKETFWFTVNKEEKSGLITFMVFVSAVLIFNIGVNVGKYML
jgi:hypothetical protein